MLEKINEQFPAVVYDTKAATHFYKPRLCSDFNATQKSLEYVYFERLTTRADPLPANMGQYARSHNEQYMSEWLCPLPEAEQPYVYSFFPDSNDEAAASILDDATAWDGAKYMRPQAHGLIPPYDLALEVKAQKEGDKARKARKAKKAIISAPERQKKGQSVKTAALSKAKNLRKPTSVELYFFCYPNTIRLTFNR